MRLLLGQLEISQLTKSADFSGKGAFTGNVAVKFKSRLPIKEIKTLMKSIESSCGRRKSKARNWDALVWTWTCFCVKMRVREILPPR